MGRASLAAFAVALLTLTTAPAAFASDAPTTTWTTNGTVAATLVHGGAVYVGGSFSRVGPRSGGGVVVDDTLGLRNAAASPEVAGRVSAVAADGSGGWYVGGSFAGIGTTAISRLAHVMADGSVDESFAPFLSAGPSALAVSSGVVYAGGANYLTAIDSNGITLWSASADGPVGHLAAGGGLLYAGGSFSTIGGQGRSRLAALDAATGAVTPWNPAPSGGFPFGPNVSDLVTSGGVVYVAGAFTQIGGQSRAGLAAIDGGGVATAWNPTPTGNVSAMAIAGGTLYAGGSFTTIGGQSRTGLAALSLATGNATAWQPAVPGLQIGVLTATASQVFAAGSSNAGAYLAALDATTALASSWDPRPGTSPGVLAVSGNRVYMGGAFTSINTIPRRNAAGFDLGTGAATAWDPTVTDSGILGGPPAVSALATSGSTIYLGGSFSKVGGVTRSGIAAVDDVAGALSAWNPGATFDPSDTGVAALLVDGSLLYAGGQFSQLGGQSRSNIAAVDVATGSATSWNPAATGGGVRSIIKVGTSYVLGGDFTAAGGQPRGGLAALDAGGAATAWNPGTDGAVNALAADGSTIYIGGTFTTLSGQSRSRLGAVDATTGAATSLTLPIIGEPPHVDALALSGSRLYIGGDFLLGAGQIPALAELDTTTGALTRFRANRYGLVKALATSGTKVLVGGSDLSLSQADQLGDGFGTFDPAAAAPAPFPFRSATLITLLDAPFVVGSTAVCHLPGPTAFWNSPTSFSYTWSRDGNVIAGATTDQHVIGTADAGHVLRCTATATNAAGSGHTTTRAMRVPSAPPDTTPPTITITTPADGQHFALGQAVTPIYSCDDPGGSGVASCTAGSVDTSSPGTKAFTATAADNAGNPATTSVTYVVDAPSPPPSVTPPPPPAVIPVVPPPPPPAAPFALRSSAIRVRTIRRSAKTVLVTIAGLPHGTVVRGQLLGRKRLAIARATSKGGATKLTFKLTATARRALRSKQLKRLKVVVTATPPGGKLSKASVMVAVR